ncbi:hypothetical protein H8E88_22040 [candidate division KSB1 bacterium]|nr:hypothetical protein [candidate division KSB1 bacterium]
MKYISKQIKMLLIVIIMNLITYSISYSCKYTVRDIGFTDLGSTPYQLYLYFDNNTPEKIVSAFQRITYAALLDANVEAETIDIKQQTQHQGLSFLRSQNIKSMPAVILMSSDGSAVNLPFSYSDNNYNEPVWQIVEKVVSSPLREKIVKSVATTYGVVLLIEGKDKKQNSLAQKVLKRAIEDISLVLDIMPKPIKEPPQLIEVSQQQFLQEKVLFWSLDVKMKDTNEPQVAILYGRGRRIGPVLKGDEITKNNVFSLLSLIGADCECGLDRSWMLGKMIPLRWDSKIQSGLIKSLGFDVESPMVKAEMSQILSLAPSFLGQNKKSITPLTAYSEGIIKFNNTSTVPTVSPNQFGEVLESESNSLFRVGLLLGIGFILIVLVIGGIVFIRAKRRE